MMFCSFCALEEKAKDQQFFLLFNSVQFGLVLLWWQPMWGVGLQLRLRSNVMSLGLWLSILVYQTSEVLPVFLIAVTTYSKRNSFSKEWIIPCVLHLDKNDIVHFVVCPLRSVFAPNVPREKMIPGRFRWHQNNAHVTFKVHIPICSAYTCAISSNRLQRKWKIYSSFIVSFGVHVYYSVYRLILATSLPIIRIVLYCSLYYEPTAYIKLYNFADVSCSNSVCFLWTRCRLYIICISLYIYSYIHILYI